MKVRDKKHTWTGVAIDFNTHALSEVIVGFDGEGGMDSMFTSELEVFVPALNQWKDMDQAFKDKDIIPDNLNTSFGEPKNDEERKQGYY